MDRVQDWINNGDNRISNDRLPTRTYDVYHNGSASYARNPICAYGGGTNDGLMDCQYGYYNVVGASTYFIPHTSNAGGS